ncbi:MAG: hypothetical protein Q9218_004125 [Villophora microphyllina]
MSSRYPPPDQGDARYIPRDRSPPRFPDRRSSAPYSGGLQSNRVGDVNYKSFEANAHQQQGRDPPREPPRGPKGFVDAPRGGYPPRGRGFVGRGDFRDRDFRESRDAPLGRGERDREWGYRGSADLRGRRISPPGRGRTRSPPLRDYGRDTRDPMPRESDRDRFRREPQVEQSHPVGYRGRGGFRGRGRGDWDFGQRGRRPYADERDCFRVSSRSQDRGWDRRDERDQDHPRRDDDYRRPWEDRDRDFDKFRRDPPYRPDSRNSSATNPSTPHSANAPFSSQQGADRASQNFKGTNSDSSRRSSGPNATMNHMGPSRETGRPDSLSIRPDRDRVIQQPPSSPPQAPQVPAFGSISYRPPAIDQSTVTAKRTEKDTGITEPILPGTQETSRLPPSAPRAHLSINAQTAQTAEYATKDNEFGSLGSVRNPADVTASVPPTAPSGPRLSTADLSEDSSFRTSQASVHPRPMSENIASRSLGAISGSPIAARPSSLQLVYPSRRELTGEQTRQDSLNASPGRPTHREILIPGQPSPAKVPTGPRAERSAPSIRQVVSPGPRAPPIRHPNPQWRSGQANLTWVRPGLGQGLPQNTPRGPSIMNTVPTKRDNAGEEKVKLPPREIEDHAGTDEIWPRNDNTLRAALDEAKAEGEKLESALRSPALKLTENASDEEKKDTSHNEAVARSSTSDVPKKSEVEGSAEQDGSTDLDEADFQKAEQEHNHQLRMLEAKRPPLAFHNQELLSLLEECDALDSAAEDLANGFVPELRVESRAAHTIVSGLPSPKPELPEEMETDADLSYDAVLAVTRQPTPPIERLPFLASGPPTPFSQMDDLKLDFDLHDHVRSRIMDKLTAQAEELAIRDGQVKNDYAKSYRRWREKNQKLEAEEKEKNDAAPPPPPVEVVPVNLGPMTSISGNRRVRGNSDFQMVAALELSKQTAQDEEEKRLHVLADRGPNYDKEAVVPDMWTEYESQTCFFDDRNNLIPGHMALQALTFLPKKDDFTSEEHEKFVDQYMQNPKRWGTIADSLPDRTYQDCVQHYYLTKGTCLYKERERVFLRNKKNRRGGARGPQGGRIKSSNLMPSCDGNTEADQAATAVTETGRPKRNAAPVFGATSDTEGATPAATPMRRNAAPTRADMNGEPSAEKPRRRAGGLTREKGAKKGKNVPLAAAPGPSPQKPEKDNVRAKSREPRLEMEQRQEDLEGAQLLAGLHSSQMMTVPSGPPAATEIWINRQSQPDDTAVAATQNPPPMLPPSQQQPPFEPQSQTPQQRSGPPSTSSYWSVPELENFKNLLCHWGTNWQAIADTMKTKSVTMVRNYYHRACQKEEGPFLKQMAKIADDKRHRGEDMGPLPTPAGQTKRRTETTPAQMPSRRTLAPSVEHLDAENEVLQAQPSKPAQIPAPQSTPSQARYQTLAQADAIPVPAFSQPASQGPMGTGPRTSSQQLQRQTSQPRSDQPQGPRSGYFSEQRSRPILQAQPPGDLQKFQQQQRQAQQEEEANLIRQVEAQNHAEAAKRLSQSEFFDNLKQQHKDLHPEQAHSRVQHNPSARNQQTVGLQSLLDSSQPTSSQVRHLEPRPQISSQTQQPTFENIQHEPSARIIRAQSVTQARVQQPTMQSPATARTPLAMSPRDEIIRPSSILSAPVQAPPRPTPTPTPIKRSNLMSILNEEPSEPPLPRRKVEETPSTPSLPTQRSQQLHMTLTQPYRPPSQPSQPISARDQGLERSTQALHQQQRSSISQPNLLQQQAQAQAQAREAPTSWVAAVSRPAYQPGQINSPHPPAVYLQQNPRNSLQSLQRGHAPSPPPSPYVHSRSSSYTNGPPTQQQAPREQQMQSHHSIQSQPPQPNQSHAAPNLQPSPYATIQPHHQHLHTHPHQLSQQLRTQEHAEQHAATHRRLDERHHADLERRRARQDAVLQHETTAQHHLSHPTRHHHQHQQPHQQHLQHRSVNEPPPPRTQPDQPQSSFLRPKDLGGSMGEIDERFGQYQQTLMRQEKERSEEQAKRDGRVFTPPGGYGGMGYRAPPGQQSSQSHGR